ncbi:MAG: HAMP domain-containing sensor histidine kinase [Candidatus Sericytochromatia bacterium]|nr:HAMP domain-containing sensor histidine kinase [Candidatus Sericytochromatia bacterium]
MRAWRQSIVPPIVFGVLLILIVILLGTTWNLTLIRDPGTWQRVFEPGSWGRTLMLVAGTLLFLAVIAGLVLYVVFLAQQIRANQLQQNVMDAVTHEFRSPLTSLRLSLDTLRRKDVPPEEARMFLAMMDDDCARLQVLVERVLEAGRLEAGSRSYRIEEVPMRSLLAELAGRMKQRLRLDDACISLPSREAWVRADAGALDMVCTNLLENAVKYSPEDRISVALDLRQGKVPGQVMLLIADQGIGWAPGNERRIFRRFVRLGDEMTRRRKGIGLGLYLARSMVRGMGGTIEAASPGVGKGAVFTVTLPGRMDGENPDRRG